MTTADQPSSNQLAAFHARGRQLLIEQTRSLDMIIHSLHSIDPAQTRPSVWVPTLMLQAVGVSVHSVLALTRERDMAIRDGFGIARSAVETAINAAFIAVEGEELAQRAIRHMRQKRWRDLHREARIGDFQITTSRDVGLEIDDISGLREALDEFTRKKGGAEIREWTDVSLADRIAAISAKSRRGGLGLGSAFFGIYRPGSELLHGSYYGVNYFWQGSRETPARDHDAFEHLWVMEHFTTLLSCIFLGVSGAIDAISTINDLPDHAVRQDLLSRQLQILVKGMSAADPDDQHSFTAEVSRRDPDAG
ncbi:DUF5677 domain-containing protein [Sphingomonas dokdonensis]|uniref:Uncharacterized protein n=1 Tax=Sphingomonas dokdonensis TaxID=344880 RepID=A0A245ZNJ3_9SPHN|nr:DUF5677 domain-containing protein [Sphingomonas dokdonensis]OWK31306.1 hypothetical protein SPDO_13130 [Sphingomonas dokdonensis]